MDGENLWQSGMENGLGAVFSIGRKNAVPALKARGVYTDMNKGGTTKLSSFGESFLFS